MDAAMLYFAIAGACLPCFRRVCEFDLKTCFCTLVNVETHVPLVLHIGDSCCEIFGDHVRRRRAEQIWVLDEDFGETVKA